MKFPRAIVQKEKGLFKLLGLCLLRKAVFEVKKADCHLNNGCMNFKMAIVT